jgi:hypothetical protein
LISTEYLTQQPGNTHSFLQLTELLGYKTSLNKFKKIKITPCIITDHNRIKLDLNKKRGHRKYSNTWRLNNTLLKKQWVTEEIREEIKKVPRIQ